MGCTTRLITNDQRIESLERRLYKYASNNHPITTVGTTTNQNQLRRRCRWTRSRPRPAAAPTTTFPRRACPSSASSTFRRWHLRCGAPGGGGPGQGGRHAGSPLGRGPWGVHRPRRALPRRHLQGRQPQHADGLHHRLPRPHVGPGRSTHHHRRHREALPIKKPPLGDLLCSRANQAIHASSSIESKMVELVLQCFDFFSFNVRAKMLLGPDMD
jgi:hypothetical protein